MPDPSYVLFIEPIDITHIVSRIFIEYSETRELSDKLTPQIFKSFPREGIDLEWYKYKWKTYPYEEQKIRFGERWHEDGL